MTITELVTLAYENSKAKGFHAEPTTFGDRIALCHSELSEALEAYRDGMAMQWTAYEVGGGETSLCSVTHKGELRKPVGIPSELADVVIRIADMCGAYGIDLEKAITEKMAYNATRTYRHGGKKL